MIYKYLLASFLLLIFQLTTITTARKIKGERFALQMEGHLDPNMWPTVFQRRSLCMTLVVWPHLNNTLYLNPKESLPMVMVARLDPHSEDRDQCDFDFVQPDGQSGRLSWQLGADEKNPEMCFRAGITNDLNVPWGYTNISQHATDAGDSIPHFGMYWDPGEKNPKNANPENGWLRPPGISPKKIWRWELHRWLNWDYQTGTGMRIEALKYPKGTWVICNLPVYSTPGIRGGMIDIAEIFYSFDGVTAQVPGCQSIVIKKVPKKKK